MRIRLNGAWHELPGAADAASSAEAVRIGAGGVAAAGAATLAALLQTCGYGAAIVATAVNGQFVPARARADTALRDGDRVEVLAPMQGG